MKYQELDNRQKKAYKNIKYCAIDYIFSMVNGCYDSSSDSDEYKSYVATIKDLNGLIDTVYNEALTSVYDEDGCYFGAGAESYLKDVRFCGKEFLMEVATKLCKKYQQEALSEIE